MGTTVSEKGGGKRMVAATTEALSCITMPKRGSSWGGCLAAGGSSIPEEQLGERLRRAKFCAGLPFPILEIMGDSNEKRRNLESGCLRTSGVALASLGNCLFRNWSLRTFGKRGRCLNWRLK